MADTELVPCPPMMLDASKLFDVGPEEPVFNVELGLKGLTPADDEQPCSA